MLSRRRRAALLSTGLALTLTGAGVLTPTTASAASTRYEAEAAPATCAGTIDSNWTGFSGTGFCNADNTAGAAVEFTVDAPEAGTAKLGIRFANGTTTARLAEVVVNGSTTQTVSLDGTGAWDTWATRTVTAPVNAGSNKIRLNPTSANGLPNVDHLDFEAGGTPPTNGRQVERLDRGVVSVRSGTGNLVSWRLLGTDPPNVTFNLYRDSARIYSGPLTNHLDPGVSATSAYAVRAVVDGVEQPTSPTSINFSSGYLDVPIQRPAGGRTPDGVSYTYEANDASVGDVDGDGVLEIVLKWNPTNAKDNSQGGYTGNVYIDAYRLNGARLWRVDLGRNIRAGAHYTQFQVYDYDGDGRAELAVKTGDGTVSGTGQVIGSASADHRNSTGYVITGPEYLTVFNGLTGAVLSTVNFEPARGNICDWGDCTGNRGDRFLAGTAYLDGHRPSIVMGRGYYEKSTIAAWDYRDGQLTRRWKFDSGSAGRQWTGRGTHSLSIADVDGNGTDEVVYGGMTINSDGTGRYTTNFYAHGDALHVSDFVPGRPGEEIWQIHEQSSGAAATLRDANSGAIIMQKNNSCNCEGPARGVAGDIYAGNAGAEFWGTGTGLTNLFNGSGASVGRTPGSYNFLAWWDGDLVRELLDGNHVDKYGTGGDTRLLTGSGTHSVNGTKSTPSLSGDLFGDWREEVVLPRDDNLALRIYSTPIQTSTRMYTLLHDPQYRVAVAWQNTAYNQPPHPSFFLGNGMSTPPRPDVYVP